MKNTVIYEGDSPTVPSIKGAQGEYAFVCGPLKTIMPCIDAEFNVRTEQPWLRRKVETYMWQEYRVKQHDVVKYEYKSVWSEDYIDSKNFKMIGYNNTKAPYTSKDFTSPTVTMGIFRIDIQALVSCLWDTKPVALRDVSGQPLYIHSSDLPQHPKIGDTRTTFSVQDCFSDKNQVFAILGKKRGDTIVAEMANKGQLTLRQLIDKRLANNSSNQFVVRLLFLSGIAALLTARFYFK